MSDINPYGMSDRHYLFVLEYLKTFNKRQSAIKAGFSPVSAGSSANNILKREEVRKFIQDELRRTHLNAQKVLAMLAEIATSNIGSLFEVQQHPEHGYDQLVLNFDEVAAQGHLIKSIKPAKGGYAVEMYDKMRALEMLGKHLNLFVSTESPDWENKKLPDGRSAEEVKAQLRTMLLGGQPSLPGPEGDVIEDSGDNADNGDDW